MPLVRKLLLVLLLPVCLLAQQNKLVVSQPDPLILKRGSSAVAAVKVTTLPGFHVNSNHPRDEFLIPISLTWTGGPLHAGTTAYPAPETIKVGGNDVSVFTGSFQIKTEFVAPGSANQGSTEMLGKLRYQACNNQMCFRPTTVEVRLPVTIE